MEEYRIGYTFRLYPTQEQAARMRQLAGSCRFVWNRALELQEGRRARGERLLGGYALAAFLPKWKSEEGLVWLRDASASQGLQITVYDLCEAYGRFFEHLRLKKLGIPTRVVGCPRWKRKDGTGAFTIGSKRNLRVDTAAGTVSIPKTGRVRAVLHRQIDGDLRKMTVSFNARGQWFASFVVLAQRETPVHSNPGSKVGVDVGVARFATLSNGGVFKPLDLRKRYEKRLAKAQRELSKKEHNSKNWFKAKLRVAKLYGEIADTRKDFTNKASARVASEFEEVKIEALCIDKMTKSAAGTVEKPGTNVAAKRGLNRAILDQGWGLFARQLEYKTVRNGGTLTRVDPRNTSRTCPECGHVAKENRVTQAKFCCVSCGFKENADLVGAINILNSRKSTTGDGLALAACGG